MSNIGEIAIKYPYIFIKKHEQNCLFFFHMTFFLLIVSIEHKSEKLVTPKNINSGKSATITAFTVKTRINKGFKSPNFLPIFAATIQRLNKIL